MSHLTVRWRIPIRSPLDSWTNERSLRTRPQIRVSGTTVRINPLSPGQLLDKLSGRQEFPIRTIEHVNVTITVCLENELSRLALIFHVYQHRGLYRVVVVKLVGRELEVPLELA